MPPRNRNRKRPDGRRPNVFVQTERPSGRSESTTADQAGIDDAPSPAISPQATAAPPQHHTSGRRTQRTRSEVYARTFPLEIRKMGIISVGIVIALAAFTIAL